MEGTFQPNDPALFIQPQAFPNDTGVGSSRTTTSNSLSGTADLDNFHWRDHVFRSGVTYFAPWQLILGATYAVQSGQNSGPVVMRLPAGDPAFGPPTIRLSNGRVVSNPLSTPIRFAYPTRGEGQLMTPVVHLFNVRVGRSFVLGAQRRLELSADVLNLPNAGAGQSFQSGGNQQYSTTYGLHTTYQSPRSARFSARFTF
jgi:hypothetical protein